MVTSAWITYFALMVIAIAYHNEFDGWKNKTLCIPASILTISLSVFLLIYDTRTFVIANIAVAITTILCMKSFVKNFLSFDEE